MFDEFIRTLVQKMEGGLPGYTAQFKMAPEGRAKTDFEKMEMHNAKLSAVLLLFYPSSGIAHLPLIVRPQYNGAHGGQVALPGGKPEIQDASLEDTALRETYEEIGVAPKDITVIGRLSKIYIPPSNYMVMPFVAFSKSQPEFVPDPAEVNALLRIPVKDLLNESIIKNTIVTTSNGIKLNTPCFMIDNNVVWGATAMILSELKELMLRNE